MDIHPLIKVIPRWQIKEVFSQDRCDIDGEFLGFTDIYENLSKIIPKYMTVIDFGCAYAPQAYYFTKHFKYIGVDSEPMTQFSTHNSEFFIMSIQNFIKNEKYIKEISFAICSYVPDFDAQELVRNTFPNTFVYYPTNCFVPDFTNYPTMKG